MIIIVIIIIVIIIVAVLCKSNASEFRRFSTKFAEIVRYVDESEFSTILRSKQKAAIVPILSKFRADMRNFIRHLVSGSTKFRVKFPLLSELSCEISFHILFGEQNFVLHVVWRGDISQEIHRPRFWNLLIHDTTEKK